MRSSRRTRGALAAVILTILTVPACTEETPPSPPPPITPQAGSVDTTSAGITALMGKLSDVKPPAQGSRAEAVVRRATQRTYTSPFVVKRPEPAKIGELLQRLGAENSDTTRLFPGVAAQVPKVWIGWHINRSVDAFRQAIDENKPLVLVLAGDWCEHCVSLATDSLRCAAVDRYAGDAVFAYSFPENDTVARTIGSNLNITAVPTITVLEPESRMLIERGRINGLFEASVLGEHLDTILWKTPARVLPADFDASLENRDAAPVPDPAAGAPRGRPATVESAAAGAASRGLSHVPPAPKCK